ncbi:hypothetical protein sscle_03g028240 [Sclerotinia sclerotiorum 1980 UF-70]|uniref:AMP-dependent synthetase/ligase domain-containing protein n=1 Tax=Sclerotinia sclerotiorum (strain ATCC 18683 / 1980 / Ss-1) TaxID=665079 RepID=A0A1D9PZD1_SCLS1|nr:hypothetical protein sscle_03g028240 [Sclerotinia sclerotiorum 1980 UF-70]
MRSHILILNEYTSLLKSANLEEGSIDIDYESFFTAVNRYAFLVDALLMGWGPTVVLCMGPGRSLLPHTYIRNVQVGHITSLSSHRREFAEVKDKPFLILYTPGSTGIPKPAHVNLCSFAANAAYQLVPSLRGKPTMVNYM